MKTYKYVIIGGGLTGGRACQGIRRVDKAGTVLLIGDEKHVPYERPALSKGYMTGKEGLDHVYVKEEDYYAQNQIDLLLGPRVSKIEPQAHMVAIDGNEVIGYGKLLLATGAHSWRLPIEGGFLRNVFTLRTIEDSDAIRQAAAGGKRALVVGGSFIGSEVASSLAQLGAQVTMVFPESRLLERVVSEEMSAFLHDKYASYGVHILSRTKPQQFEGHESVGRATLDSGQVLDVDMVVMGVGVRLNTELARDAGLEMGERGEVIVDQFLRTSDPDIYAAGDIAAWPDPTYGKRLRVEHWDVAFRQGMRVGRNMAGEEKPYETLPYFFSDLFDLSLEVWGDLTAWDRTVRRGAVESGGYAFYYFYGGQLTGVLAVGRPDGERKPMQALVQARPTYADVAGPLADEATDLATLAG